MIVLWDVWSKEREERVDFVMAPDREVAMLLAMLRYGTAVFVVPHNLEEVA